MAPLGTQLLVALVRTANVSRAVPDQNLSGLPCVQHDTACTVGRPEVVERGQFSEHSESVWLPKRELSECRVQQDARPEGGVHQKHGRW